MKFAYTLLAIVSGATLYVDAAEFSTMYKNDDLGLSNTTFYKHPDTLKFDSYQKTFEQAVLDEFKEKMNAVGDKYIKRDKSLYSQFQTCKVLMTNIQLALAIANDTINQALQKKISDTDGIERIYKALQPVVQSLKKLKGSLLSRVKGAFAKSSVEAEQALKDIKDILTKRAKELIDDYNKSLKDYSDIDKPFKKKMTINL